MRIVPAPAPRHDNSTSLNYDLNAARKLLPLCSYSLCNLLPNLFVQSIHLFTLLLDFFKQFTYTHESQASTLTCIKRPNPASPQSYTIKKSRKRGGNKHTDDLVLTSRRERNRCCACYLLRLFNTRQPQQHPIRRFIQKNCSKRLQHALTNLHSASWSSHIYKKHHFLHPWYTFNRNRRLTALLSIMARATVITNIIERKRTYSWPEAQLNFWLIIMLAASATITGIFANFLAIQNQFKVGSPW